MIAFIIGFLLLWLVLAILGLVLKGLFWLFWVAAVLFVATLVISALSRVFSRTHRQ